MLLRLNYTYIIQTNRPALQPKFFVEYPFELFVPAVFFVGRKLKPQSNKSHRAMHGSSPCGATEGNKCQLDSIFQNISAFVFK